MPCTRQAARSLNGVRVLAEAATPRVCVSAVLLGHVIDCSHVQHMYVCICFRLRAEVLSWLSVASSAVDLGHIVYSPDPEKRAVVLETSGKGILAGRSTSQEHLQWV